MAGQDNGARVLTAAGAGWLAKSWFASDISAVAAMSAVSFLVYACIVAVTPAPLVSPHS